MLDKNTFGNTPAAIYLADRLNEVDNSKQTRKVSTFINSIRSMLKQAIEAHEYGYLSLKTLYFIADSLSIKVHNSVDDLLKVTEDAIDPLVVNLTANILIGEIKSIKRRTQSATYLKKEQERKFQNSPNGYSKLHMSPGGTLLGVENLLLTNITVAHVKDPIDYEVLFHRAQKRFKRRSSI